MARDLPCLNLGRIALYPAAAATIYGQNLAPGNTLTLQYAGGLSPGAAGTITLQGGPPNAFGALALSLLPAGLHFSGYFGSAILLVDLITPGIWQVHPLMLDGAGVATIPITVEPTGILSGRSLYFQGAAGNNAFDVRFSPGLQLVFGY